MAADAYLRTASLQLQTAVSDMQSQIHSMQQNVNQQKHQLQQEITRLEQERNVHGMELNHLQDDTQKRLIQDRVSHINHQCDANRSQMAQLDSQLSTAIQRKTQLSNTLHNIAGQLDLLMASPDLH